MDLDVSNNSDTFYCETCNYFTERRSNWKRHILSEKHLKSLTKPHKCLGCGKCYKHFSSLTRHQKCCESFRTSLNSSNSSTVSNTQDDVSKNTPADSNKSVCILNYANACDSNVTDNLAILKAKAELYDTQQKDMADLRNMIQQMSKKKSKVVNYWNVNIFLETRCKNAMNIEDFVDNLNLTQKDLVYTQQNGYVEGMSQVFINGLKELTPEKRPIHCVNQQQNLYIREDGKWAQDNDGKVLGTQISAVTKKQLFALKTWEREHPNWKNSESQTKTYMELVQKTLGCSTDKEHRRSVLKICKNIGKKTSIDDII